MIKFFFQPSAERVLLKGKGFTGNKVNENQCLPQGVASTVARFVYALVGGKVT
jgi:hypothetical protein